MARPEMYAPSRCKTPSYLCRPQTIPSQGRRYKVEIGNWRKFGWTYCHGTIFAPREYLCQKEATGIVRPEMYSPGQCKNPSYLCRSSNYMVPCLHQGNIYIKRKIRVWRDQKCIPLVGAKIPLTCADHQTILSQERRYRVDNGNLRKLGWIYCHGTVFAPRQYLFQNEAMGMERPEMYSSCRCKNHSYLC